MYTDTGVMTFKRSNMNERIMRNELGKKTRNIEKSKKQNSTTVY